MGLRRRAGRNPQLPGPEPARTSSDALGEHYVVVDFKGWRYFELIEPEAERFEDYRWPYYRPKLEWDKEVESADAAPPHWVAGHYGIYRESPSYGAIQLLNVWYNNLPPGKTVTTYVSPIKALPLVSEKLVNPSIAIDGKKLTFPCEIESGAYLEFISMADCKLYNKEGVVVADVKPVGDAPVIDHGEHTVSFEAATSDGLTPRAYVTVITEGESL